MPFNTITSGMVKPYDWVTMFALNIQTDMSEQIVSTLIRLLLEQSDQG